MVHVVIGAIVRESAVHGSVDRLRDHHHRALAHSHVRTFMLLSQNFSTFHRSGIEEDIAADTLDVGYRCFVTKL